jgi:hypothetical protein
MRLALMIYCVAVTVLFPPLQGWLFILFALICRAWYRYDPDGDSRVMLRIEPTFP